MNEALNTTLAPRRLSHKKGYLCKLSQALFAADLSHMNTYEIEGVHEEIEGAVHKLRVELANEESCVLDDREIEVDDMGYAEFTIDSQLYRFRFQCRRAMEFEDVEFYCTPVVADPVQQPAAPPTRTFNRGAATERGGRATPSWRLELHKLPLNLPDSLDLK